MKKQRLFRPGYFRNKKPAGRTHDFRANREHWERWEEWNARRPEQQKADPNSVTSIKLRHRCPRATARKIQSGEIQVRR